MGPGIIFQYMDLFKRIVFAMVAPIVIGGCYAHSRAYDYDDGYYTVYAPPALIYEQEGPAPYAGGVWINGYWGWNDNQYVWRHGYWSQPRPGYVWQRHAWVRDGHGWRLHAGYWRRVR